MRTLWAYGVTTVPSRRSTFLPRTLMSLKAAGFPTPHLFVDGDDDGASWRQEFKLNVTCRSRPHVRTSGNCLLSLMEMVHRNPTADYYALFQDDCVAYRNLRNYLEQTLNEGRLYWNLYAHPENERLVSHNYAGWMESDQCGRGAVGLVYHREVLVDVLSTKHIARKPLCAAKGWRNVDGALIEGARQAGVKEMVHVPSLLMHIGNKDSAIGNDEQPLPNTFLGEDFDALILLRGRNKPRV